MYFQPLLLLILSAGALALPSNHTKRHGDSWPNIATYSDSACMNQVSPLQDFKGCVSISFTSKYVGVNWGNWPVGMDAFDAFKDNSCQNYAAKTMVEPAGGPDAQGANTCYELGAHGGPWGSVQQNYDN